MQRVFFVSYNTEILRNGTLRPNYYLDQSKDSLLQERPNFAEEFLTEKRKKSASKSCNGGLKSWCRKVQFHRQNLKRVLRKPTVAHQDNIAPRTQKWRPKHARFEMYCLGRWKMQLWVEQRGSVVPCAKLSRIALTWDELLCPTFNAKYSDLEARRGRIRKLRSS